MRLLWRKGKNPYRFNYYGALGVGAGATRKSIATRAKQLTAKIKAGNSVELDAQELTEHEVQEAQSRLGDIKTRTTELLLVHEKGKKQKRESQDLAKALERATEIPDGPVELPLRHPAAVFCFVPEPEPGLVPEPDLRSLGLVSASDPADRDLDIVFDE